MPSSPTTEEVKSQTNQIRVRSSIVMQQMEVAQQRRQQKLELFRTIKQMRVAGMKVSQIASQLGLCRRRIDKWIQLDELSERNRMQPRPGMPGRLLLGTRKIPFAVAPAKSRDPKGSLRVPRRAAT